MADFNLQVNYREKKGRSYRKELSSRDMVPGVVYGKAVGSVPVEFDYKPLKQILAKGKNAVIDLTVNGPGTDARSYKVLIKELQHDPIKRDVVNVDFQQISMDDAIQTTVPLNYVGEIKDGILQYGLRELQVSCLPADIPQEITVDIDGLSTGSTITVKDVSVPKKVTLLDDPDAVLVTVVAQRKEEEPAAETEAGKGEAGVAEGEKPAE